MAHSIVLPNEFEESAINFLPPKQNKLGGQSVLVNYNPSGSDRSGAFILQTCRVRIPFGIDSSKPENGGPVKYHISLSMANDETQNEGLKQFTNNVRSIDAKAKMHPQESESWFSKKLSAELVNEFYKSAEKFPKDPKWPSNLKVKLPFDKKGVAQFAVYDEKKKPIDIVDADGNVNTDAIPRGCEAVCLIQSTGVWFVGKTQYGVGYKLLQAKIYKSNKLSGYSIVDSEDEAEEEDVE
tara:strand:- start:678 stop:1394 length:717 start_codon:yes stop_codon:yes gene_type:complete